DKRIFDLNIPILGICYGHHLMAFLQRGYVKPAPTKEFGPAELTINDNSHIFKDIDTKQTVWMSHGDSVTVVPRNFKVIASTKDCENAAIADEQMKFYGVQFHPEVTHTACGDQIFNNFLEICNAKRDWDLSEYLEKKIAYIKDYVRDRRVFMLISGGVDSTVSFAILEKALGKERVYGLFVDTGFMRYQEKEQVEKALKEIGVENLHVYDAKKEFYSSLKNVYDPEIKRAVIGNLFLEIKDKVSKDLRLNIDEWMLGQGTIYPDTIESGGTQYSSRIKTHHNRVEGIQELIKRKRIIEPVKELYKDEVRQIGEKLGLPKELVWRQPFPGPGLAVRILCAKKENYPPNHLALERQVNMLLAETDNLKGKVLPIKSVGVQGDNRTYRHPLVIYGDTTWDELKNISTKLINQFKEINRVVYGFGISNIENVQLSLSELAEDRIKLLQKADKIVQDAIFEKDLTKDIWQFPVVLLPVNFNNQGKESIVLRPVESMDAMSAGVYELDWMTVKKIADDLLIIPDISAVLYDVTSKPPATIEWE
ncbi:hypothetical protein A2483_04575, partial [Candidatus Peregrinibacteria bacterium RIFOXYC2_FULL_33_13]